VVPKDSSDAVKAAHVVAADAHLTFVATGDTAADEDTAPEVAGICLPDQVERLHVLRKALRDLGEDDSEVDGVLAEIERERAGSLPDEHVDAGAAWRDTWAAVGGRVRPSRVVVTRMTPVSAKVRDLLGELGAADGIEVNLLADRRQRKDSTIDHLSLMSVREPRRYRRFVARLAAAPGCLVRDLLLAHRAYVDNDMAAAAAGYARLLVRVPHDIDLWRDFAFALRHLGRPDLCETWLFHEDEVVSRAVGCAPDPRPVALLGHGRLDAPAAQRFLVGLLEWVSHDLDRR
jgi:hypothetical protein